MSGGGFSDFEMAGWNEVAEGYSSSRVVSGFSMQAGALLADAVKAGPGRRILDLACGPGYAAAEAARRGADVIGVDIAAAMISTAQQNVPTGEFHVSSAEQLPFPDDHVDGVMCGLGLPHFADAERVFAEVRRVTRPDGQIAFTTWCTPDKVPFFGIVFTAVAEHGSLEVDLPDGPDMFRFAVESEAEAVLAAEGFVDVCFETLPLTAAVESGAEAMDLVTRATVRTRALYEAQTDAARSAIAEYVAQSVEALRGTDGSITVDMPAVLISARVPNP